MPIPIYFFPTLFVHPHFSLDDFLEFFIFMKKTRVSKKLLPFDCWCGVIEFFSESLDILNLFYAIKGVRNHISFINPGCTRNAQFSLNRKPLKKVLFVTNLRIETNKFKQFWTKKFLFTFIQKYFPNILRISFVGREYPEKNVELEIPDNFTPPLNELIIHDVEANFSFLRSLKKISICQVSMGSTYTLNQIGINGVEELTLGKLPLFGEYNMFQPEFYYRNISRISDLDNLKILKFYPSSSKSRQRRMDEDSQERVRLVLTISNLRNLQYLQILPTSYIDPEEGIFRVEGEFPSLRTIVIGLSTKERTLKENLGTVMSLHESRSSCVSICELEYSTFPKLEYLELYQGLLYSVVSKEKFDDGEEGNKGFNIDGLLNLKVLRMGSVFTGVDNIIIDKIRNCPKIEVLDVDHLQLWKCDSEFPLVKILKLNEKHICEPDDSMGFGNPPIQRYNLSDGSFDTSKTQFNHMFPNLQVLTFGFERKYDSVDTFIIQDHPCLEKIVFDRCYNHYNELSLLRVEKCKSLKKIEAGFFVRRLEVRSCPVLEMIVREGGHNVDLMGEERSTLQNLLISDCPSMKSLDLSKCELKEFPSCFFDSLETLEFNAGESRIPFPNNLQSLSSSIIHMEISGSPPNLTKIDNLNSLEYLIIKSDLLSSLGDNLNSLTYLDIISCERILKIPKYPNLRYLAVQPKIFFNEFSGFPSLYEIRLEIPSVLHTFQFSTKSFCSFRRLPAEFFLLEEIKFSFCPNLRIVEAVNFNHLGKYFDKNIRFLFTQDMNMEEIQLYHLKDEGWISIIEERNESEEENKKIEIEYAEFCEGCGKFRRREGEFRYEGDNKLDSLEDECEKCGTQYCSMDCKNRDWEKKHKYICGGVEVQEDSSLCGIL